MGTAVRRLSSGFRDGSFQQILVATDIAARGHRREPDLPRDQLRHPRHPEAYISIGRTGRAKTGEKFTFITST